MAGIPWYYKDGGVMPLPLCGFSQTNLETALDSTPACMFKRHYIEGEFGEVEIA